MARLTASDLQLVLGPRPERRVGRWLSDAVREAVDAGHLEPGAVLPSGRELARALGVARGTVVEALDALVGAGMLQSRPRSALVVATPAPTERSPAPHPGRPTPPSPGTPDPALFPRAAWARAVRAGLATLTDRDLGYPDPQGWPGLRSVLADHLRRSRGARVRADDLVIVSGVGQALALVADVLRRRGTPVLAAEDPGSPGAVDLLRYQGLSVRPTPVDDDGLVVDALAADLGAVLVTPAHQFPLGVTLRPDRRRALVAWAADGDRLVVEDDYDGELRYDRAPIAVVQSLAPEHVALVGSVSKTLSPALRLGWLVAPPAWRAELIAAKYHADLGAPAVEQAALAELLATGEYQRHVRRARRRYQQRRTALLGALAEAVPALAPRGIAAGLHLVLPLESIEDERRAVTALTAAGASVLPLTATYQRDPRPGLVLGTARATPDLVRLIAPG